MKMRAAALCPARSRASTSRRSTGLVLVVAHEDAVCELAVRGEGEALLRELLTAVRDR